MEPEKDKDKEKLERQGRMVRRVGIFTTIPMLFLAASVLGYYIGNYLDQRFHTDGVLTAVFVFLFIGAAFREIFSMVKKL